MKSGSKRSINWNKYQSKVKIARQNQYLDYLIDPSSPVVNILFVLSLEEYAVRKEQTRYVFSSVEIKGYNVKINRQNFF